MFDSQNRIIMKTHKTLLLVVLTIASSVAFITGCTDDDDINPAVVPAAVKAEFAEMFPHASGIDWEYQYGYYVADFSYSTFDTEAWFAPSGSWAMTETDYDTMLEMLPSEVQMAFQDCRYAGYIVDDALYYQRPATSFCIIEVENATGTELSVFFDMYGNLLGAEPSDQLPPITPDTVVSTLLQ